MLLVWAGLTAMSVFGALQVRFAHDPMSWFPGRTIPPRRERVRERAAQRDDVPRGRGRHRATRTACTIRPCSNDLDDLRRFALGFQKGEVFVGKTVSPADVLKEIHQALNENRASATRSADDRKLVAQEFLLFESAGSDDLEKLVDSRFQPGPHDAQVPVPRRDPVRPLSRRARSRASARCSATAQSAQFTGLLVMAGRTIDAVIYSLASSYVLPFLVIAPLMILMIGNIRLGLLSMLPNLAPVIVTLGADGLARACRSTPSRC